MADLVQRTGKKRWRIFFGKKEKKPSVDQNAELAEFWSKVECDNIDGKTISQVTRYISQYFIQSGLNVEL